MEKSKRSFGGSGLPSWDVRTTRKGDLADFTCIDTKNSPEAFFSVAAITSLGCQFSSSAAALYTKKWKAQCVKIDTVLPDTSLLLYHGTEPRTRSLPAWKLNLHFLCMTYLRTGTVDRAWKSCKSKLLCQNVYSTSRKTDMALGKNLQDIILISQYLRFSSTFDVVPPL